MAVIKSRPALHHSVDFIFKSFGSLSPLLNFENILGSLMRPNWPKLVSLVQKQNVILKDCSCFGVLLPSKGYPFKNIHYER